MEKVEKLAELQKRIRSAMKDGVLAPLRISREVLSVAECWDQEYKEAAGGASCTNWLRNSFGRGKDLRYFTERVAALEWLGNDIITWVHHDVAVWLMGRTKEDKDLMVKCRTALRASYKARPSGLPLTPAEARRLIEPMLGKRKVKRVCLECARLTARIRELEAAAGLDARH